MYALSLALILLTALQQQPHNPLAKSNHKSKPYAETQQQNADAGQDRLCSNREINAQPKKTQHEKDEDDLDRKFQRWYWGATIAGVALALATLIALICQVKAARESADAAKESADAADRNANALIEGQRAQLTVHIRTNVVHEVEAGKIPKVRFDVKNTGPTAAYKCTYETWCEIFPASLIKSPDTFTGFSDAAKHVAFTEPLTIYSNATTPTIAHVWLGRPVTEEELSGLRKGKLVLAFRIRFEYLDAFKKTRYQDFGFYAQTYGMSFLPKYNDSN